jgi:hypothetical protein
MLTNKGIDGPFRRFLVLALCAAVGNASGCSCSGTPVKFILPVGYRGAFVIRVDPEGGAAFSARDGYIEVPIPNSGLVLAKSVSFLRRWHSWSAEFENRLGIVDAIILEELLTYSSEKECLLNQVCFKGIGTDGDGASYYYVGSLKEILECQRSGLLSLSVGNRDSRATTMPTWGS